jgi:hypothetical protein
VASAINVGLAGGSPRLPITQPMAPAQVTAKVISILETNNITMLFRNEVDFLNSNLQPLLFQGLNLIYKYDLDLKSIIIDENILYKYY